MSKSLVVLDTVDPVACCPPLSAQPRSQAQAEQVAPLLEGARRPGAAAADVLVASHPGGEARHRLTGRD